MSNIIVFCCLLLAAIFSIFPPSTFDVEQAESPHIFFLRGNNRIAFLCKEIERYVEKFYVFKYVFIST